MRKTQFIEIRKLILKNKVSFFSIMLFITLGIMLYFGISWAATGLVMSVDNYIERQKLYDFEVIFPYGIDDDLYGKIEAIDGIDVLQGGYVTYQKLELSHNQYQAYVSSVTDRFNVLDLKEGSLPKGDSEIVVDSIFASKHKISLGDRIKLIDDNQTDLLKNDIYTVSGIAISPMNFCMDETLNGISIMDGMAINVNLFVDESAFRDGVTKGYNSLLIQGNGLRGHLYNSSEYAKERDRLRQELSDTVLRYTGENNEKLIGGYEEELQKYRDELQKAKTDLDNYKKQLTDGEEKLSEAKKQIEEGKEQIENGQKSIEEAKKKIADSEREIAEGYAELDRGKEKYREEEQKLEDSLVTVADKKRELESGRALYIEKEGELNSARRTILDAEAKLFNAKEEFKNKKARFDEFKEDYEYARGSIASVLNAVKEYGVGIYGLSYVDSSFSDDLDTTLSFVEKYEDDISSNLLDDSSSAMDILNNSSDNDISIATLDEYVDLLENKILEAQNLLNDKEQELAAGKEKFADAESQLLEAYAQIAEGEQKIKAAELEMYNGKLQLDEAAVQIEENEQKLKNGEGELALGKKQLSEKIKELEEYKAKLEEGIKEISQKEQELLDAQEKISAGQAQYEEGLKSVSSFETMLQDIENVGFIVKTREYVNALRGVTTVGDISAKLSYSLASLFIIVGILICYSVMIRMIYLQMVQIGTKKALGFFNIQVSMLYLVYTALATILGCIVGIIGAVNVLERFFVISMLKTYPIGKITLYSNIPMAILVSFIVFVVMLGITWFSIRKNLKKNAITLLSGVSLTGYKNRFYEKFIIFQKLSLFTKTIVNNFVTDKKRVISTVIGITGCTALIVSSFTLRDNVLKSFEKQFSQYYKFNYIVKYNSKDLEAKQRITELLDEKNIPGACVFYNKGMLTMPDHTTSYTEMVVPEDYAKFSEIVYSSPYKYTDGAAIDKGLWISRGYMNYFGADKTKELTISQFDGKEATIPIAGSFNCHAVKTWTILSDDCYEQYFGGMPEYNSFFISMNEDQKDDLLIRLSEIDGYLLTEDFKANSQLTFAIFKNLTITIVIIYSAMSVAMSVLVLLNLLSQFVDEKKRELIVLMINGYSNKDAKKYVYYDTILLTVIGIICGIVLGTVVGYISIKSFDSPMVYFARGFSPQACVVGIAGSTVLIYIISKIVLRRIDKFRLTDLKE